MPTKKGNPEPGATRHFYEIELSDEQLVHVLSGLRVLLAKSKISKPKSDRIRATKEFVELQAFSAAWQDRLERQRLRLKYWDDSPN
jgi:hypothetical protein